MPKIVCLCNTIIDLSEIPSKNQLHLIEDTTLDNFGNSISAEELYKVSTIAAKCPSCGRLHIFWNGFKTAASVYLEEKH